MNYNRILIGDCRRTLRKLPKECVQTVVTSPPYFGLRDYDHPDQIGQEVSLTEFTDSLLDVFYEIKDVLRPDGTVWLNLGDSYCSKQRGLVKPKDLMGVPWTVALALRQNGWYLRQDIIWSKPNAMSESVTDRCTKSHEYLFLLSKEPVYYYDDVALREPLAPGSAERYRYSFGGNKNTQLAEADKDGVGRRTSIIGNRDVPDSRNKRSVWTINTHGFKGAHFAVFPPKLVENCIKAGTSQKGCCPKCGVPWVRKVERTRIQTRPGADTKITGTTAKTHGNRDPGRHETIVKTMGWEPGCGHKLDPEPCVVLDPFMGSGTTGMVARKLGRRWLGCELNESYAAMAEDRIYSNAVGLGLGL